MQAIHRIWRRDAHSSWGSNPGRMGRSDVSEPNEACPCKLLRTHEPESIGRPARLRNEGVSFFRLGGRASPEVKSTVVNQRPNTVVSRVEMWRGGLG